MSNHILLPACYLPPVSYFHVIKQHDLPLLLEKKEHYPKQTYRNRTSIMTSNGKLDLTVPIMHKRKDHVAMGDIRINYDHNWQRLHWLSLQTAYRSSAYFEYYEDDFAHFYKQEYEFLYELNKEQLLLMLKLLKLNRTVTDTDTYVREDENALDLRSMMHPRKPSLQEPAIPYYQVFENNNGFMPNLSIIDLLFNQGPQAKNFL
ncbi:WbqC family protein [Sphingobacterium spiritivorum]|uniref:WbqC family protein n=1 Tax=Sphingobacterium spiritivorum TaxID=258 RepID=UPI00191B43AF|nr:WbqC family protein [Sphingobacterium spiritivorum]QQT26349.1 WbqC family protein [Sphingobacterium spiritivorum]